MIRNIAIFLPQAFIWSSLVSASVELAGTIYSCLMEFDLTANALLRILLKQDTALLSHVSQCVSVSQA